MRLSDDQIKDIDKAFSALEAIEEIIDIIHFPLFIQEDVMRYNAIREVINKWQRKNTMI